MGSVVRSDTMPCINRVLHLPDDSHVGLRLKRYTKGLRYLTYSCHFLPRNIALAMTQIGTPLTCLLECELLVVTERERKGIARVFAIEQKLACAFTLAKLEMRICIHRLTLGGRSFQGVSVSGDDTTQCISPQYTSPLVRHRW